MKGEKKYVYFSNFFNTFGEFFFVKGTFSCESAICINKSVNKLFPENVKFKKRDYHFRMEVVVGMITIFFALETKVMRVFLPKERSYNNLVKNDFMMTFYL